MCRIFAIKSLRRVVYNNNAIGTSEHYSRAHRLVCFPRAHRVTRDQGAYLPQVRADRLAWAARATLCSALCTNEQEFGKERELRERERDMCAAPRYT